MQIIEFDVTKAEITSTAMLAIFNKYDVILPCKALCRGAEGAERPFVFWPAPAKFHYAGSHQYKHIASHTPIIHIYNQCQKKV